MKEISFTYTTKGFQVTLSNYDREILTQRHNRNNLFRCLQDMQMYCDNEDTTNFLRSDEFATFVAGISRKLPLAYTPKEIGTLWDTEDKNLIQEKELMIQGLYFVAFTLPQYYHLYTEKGKNAVKYILGEKDGAFEEIENAMRYVEEKILELCPFVELSIPLSPARAQKDRNARNELTFLFACFHKFCHELIFSDMEAMDFDTYLYDVCNYESEKNSGADVLLPSLAGWFR